jgi:hypothetical protein
MERDGMSEEVAKDEYRILKSEINGVLATMDLEDILEGSEEIEDILAGYDLEPDYLDDILL